LGPPVLWLTVSREPLEALAKRAQRNLVHDLATANRSAIAMPRNADEVSVPTETLMLPSLFRGPLASANGGYAAGAAAGLVDGPATVRLHKPPPVDVPLVVNRHEAGVEVLHGNEVVLAVTRRPLMTSSRPPVDFEVARSARTAKEVLDNHAAPTCFVCGTDAPDGLHIHPGRIGPGAVATAWVPPLALRDADGVIPEPIVWAAADCPGAWAITAEQVELEFFPARIEQRVDLHRPVHAGEELAVVAWQTGSEGRRCFANVALIDRDSTVLGYCEQTCYAMQVDWAQ
jgi:hypothetical protein